MYVILVIVFGISYGATASSPQDHTLIPRKGGKGIAQAVYKILEESFIFEENVDNGFILRVAAMESDFGTELFIHRPGYSGGIWQVNQANYNKTKNIMYVDIFKQLNVKFSINWQLTTWEELEKPLFSGIAFAILLHSYRIEVPNTIKGQAEFWKTHYNTNSTVSVEMFVDRILRLEKNPVCKVRGTIVIILDGSGSVGLIEYQKAKNAIVNLTMGIHRDDSRFGFISFSSTSRSVINLNSNYSSGEINQLILSVPYPGGSTMTNVAIDMAVNQLSRFSASSPRIILTFTDGKSNNPLLTLASATRATELGMIMFSVGIGSNILNDDELNVLAGRKPGHKLEVDNFDALPELIYRIGSDVCISSQTLGDDEIFRDTLSRQESRYFKYNMPEDGMTVNRKDIYGRTQGWYSYSFSTPFSGLYDGRLEEKRKTFIPKNNSSDVYITIQGVRKENNYTIVSTHGNTKRAQTAILSQAGKFFVPCAGFSDTGCQLECEKDSWIFGSCSLYLCICDE